MDTKRQAQAVAKRIGIPLSTLINAYLRDLALRGEVHFTAPEPMTPAMEKIIEQAEKEIAAGELSPAFESTEEMIAYLENLK